MNYLLYPILVNGQLTFPPRSLNYAVLLSLDLGGQTLTGSQLLDKLQTVFVHYTRLESLNLSNGYIHTVSTTSAKPPPVSRLRLTNIRFASLACFERMLLQLNEPKFGIRNLWLDNVQIESQDVEALSSRKILYVSHLWSNSAVTDILRILHGRVFWLEMTVTGSLLHTFYASPADISSYTYPLFFKTSLDYGLAYAPTIHLLFEDSTNLRALYSVPKPIAYIYLCLLFISKGFDGKRLINISSRRARVFFARVVECFKEDQTEMDPLSGTARWQGWQDSSGEGFIYSQSLALSIITFTLVMKKLMAYMEHSYLGTSEIHQIAIELDQLGVGDNDVIVLLPNFKKVLKFLRLTPSTGGNNGDNKEYKRRYSKNRISTIPPGLIKVTFLLPPSSRLLVLSYNTELLSGVTVVETPLVRCMYYSTLLNSRYFATVFKSICSDRDCVNIREHLVGFYTDIHSKHFCSTVSSFSSASNDLIPTPTEPTSSATRNVRKPNGFMGVGNAGNAANGRDATESSTESDIPFVNYRNLLCTHDCRICSAARAEARKSKDPDKFIQSLLSQQNTPFKCKNVARKSIRKLLKVQIRATPEITVAGTDITFSASQTKDCTLINETIDITSNKSLTQHGIRSSSTSFIDEATSAEDIEDSESLLSPRHTIGKLMRSTLGVRNNDGCTHNSKDGIDNSDTICTPPALHDRFENHIFFRMLEDYVDNSNPFIVFNGYILSISYETLLKVHFLEIKANTLTQHPLLKKLFIPDPAAAISCYTAYSDVYNTCKSTIQMFLADYLDQGHYARAMDKLLMSGYIGSNEKDSRQKNRPKGSAEEEAKACAKEPMLKKGGKEKHSIVLKPSVYADRPWCPKELSAERNKWKDDVFISHVHNLLWSHSSPMANSQLRASNQVTFSKEHRRLYIHFPPGIIPNTLQLYTLTFFDNAFLASFREVLKGRTTINILSIYISAYDAIYILRNGMLLKVPEQIGKINIDVLTLVYSTKMEILLIFYLLISQPKVTVTINRLNFCYSPTYRQEHLNNILNDAMYSKLKWMQSRKKDKGKGKSKDTSRQKATRSSNKVVRALSIKDSDNETKSATDDIDSAGDKDTVGSEVYTYADDDENELEGSSLGDFIAGSDSDVCKGREGNGRQDRSDISTQSNQSRTKSRKKKAREHTIIAGFSRKKGLFTSRKFDLVVYKDIVAELEQQTGLPTDTLQYTDLALQIITNLNVMQFNTHVRLCVLTSSLHDSEAFESETVQRAAEQDYAAHVIFLVKVLKCIITTDMDTFLLENVALDWSDDMRSIGKDLVARMSKLRSSVRSGTGVFYIKDSVIYTECPHV